MVPGPDDHDRPLTPVEALLNGYLDGTVAPADLVVRYRIGDSFTGETGLDLRGDGTYDAFSTVTAGRQRRSYRGQLPVDDARSLVRALRDARFWEARHVRSKPREDDPLASLSVAAGGRDAAVEVWVSEIELVPPFAAARHHPPDLGRRGARDRSLSPRSHRAASSRRSSGDQR
jgi:hypothetical protein